jgi:hypothetical protein
MGDSESERAILCRRAKGEGERDAWAFPPRANGPSASFAAAGVAWSCLSIDVPTFDLLMCESSASTRRRMGMERIERAAAMCGSAL